MVTDDLPIFILGALFGAGIVGIAVGWFARDRWKK